MEQKGVAGQGEWEKEMSKKRPGVYMLLHTLGGDSVLVSPNWNHTKVLLKCWDNEDEQQTSLVLAESDARLIATGLIRASDKIKDQK